MEEWKSKLAQWYRKELARYRKPAEAGNLEAQNSLAWIMATCEESTVRDGTSAVAYAEKAVVKTNRKNPGYLDTLAAAYAEAGEFAKAIGAESEAIALSKEEALRKRFSDRLKLYQSNTPYREP